MIFIKIEENSVNYKQSTLEGACQTVVGLGGKIQELQWSSVSLQHLLWGWERMQPLQNGSNPLCASLQPQVCCPLGRTAFKNSLCPLCSWGGKCCSRETWCLSREAASCGCELWTWRWGVCAKVSADPSVPGIPLCFPQLTFFFSSLP